MRRRLGSVLALLSLLLSFTVVTAPAASAHAYCGQTWGSAAKGASGPGGGQLRDVRAGRHACFDRLVLDLDVPRRGWSVRYVDAVKEDGSGRVVPVRGGARLEVAVWSGVRPTDSFFVSPGTLVDTSGYRTFRHVAWAGSFEDVTTVGLGVRTRLPFRAFALA